MNSRALNTSYSGSMYNQEMKPLDYLYGPWESINQMLVELNVSLEEIEPGLTVGVIDNDKVVEYWNPIPGVGFFKKTTGGSVNGTAINYTDAIENFATYENEGCFVFVENSETITLEDGSQVTYGRGLYLVIGDGQLLCLATDLWYGEFPEDERMGDDEVRLVPNDGAARVSDVYRRLKKHQLWADKNINHLNSHVKWMLEDIDKMDEEFKHIFISKVENTYGKITLIHTDLDTKNVLMSGHDEDNKDIFVKVYGTNVGNFKNGDEIPNGMTLEEFLKNLLYTEVFPTKTELPKAKLTGVGEDVVLEVGETYTTTLGIDYTDGKIQTYYGCENVDDGEMADAGCTYDDRYFVLKPGAEDFESIVGHVYSEVLTEGKYTFKVNVEYSESITTAYSNLDNPVYDLTIPAGTLTDEKSISCKYKVWANKITDPERNLVIEKDNTIEPDNIGEYGDNTWLDKNKVCVEKVILKPGEGFYVICPEECKVIFDTKIFDDVHAIEGGNYLYTLPNGEQKGYKLFYMLNPGTYTNIRVISKE